MKKAILLLFLSLIISAAYAQQNEQSIFANHNMIKVYESEIGIYYSQEKELRKIIKLDSFLNANTDSISALFCHKLSAKVQFEFYPHQALAEFVCGWDTTNKKTSSHRLGCAHYINKIQLVIPGSTASTDKIYNDWGGSNKVILHEYIHSYTYSIVGENRINKIPFLFAEGIAIFTSQQLYFNQRFKELIYTKIEQKEVPNFKKLIVNHKFIETPNSYHWAFLFTNFIVDDYGWETLLEIQKDFENLNQILGLRDREINEEWYKYLESKKIKPE